MRKWQILSVGSALVIVFVLFFWLGVSPKQNLLQLDSLKDTPDYFLTNVEVKSFDDQGEMFETIIADQVKHYNRSSRSLLINPKIDKANNDVLWKAEGDSGVVEDGSRDIMLTGNSKVTKNPGKPEEIQLTADKINYRDIDQILISHGNALLHSPQGRTQAEEIVARIHSEQVEMTGAVRGLYEPTN